MNIDDERWLKQVREHLDSEARDLDATTASRLNRARQRALDAQPAASQRWRWPAVGLATAAALMLAVVIQSRNAEAPLPAPVASTQAVDDLDLLAGTEDLEMIENLEFYAWLEQQSLDG
jgi:anti-sigma-K factor RskA